MLIEEEGCGYAVETDDADAVASECSPAHASGGSARHGRTGRRAVAERYNWQLVQHKVARVYERIAL